MNTDLERRFGGMRRLYGVDGAQAVFDAHVVVVGIGGVGSWAAEALARSGVGRITLIDLDHIAESNVNRQIHALTPTLGQSKVEAMRERIALIHPGCRVEVVDDFVTPDNWAALGEGLLKGCETLAVVDACDQVRAKTAMAAWSLSHRVPFVTVGAAGGKRLAQSIEVDDMAAVTHDPLLAKLRYTLRKAHGATRTGRMGVCCVFSRETVAPPDASCELQSPDGSLNCHGYGSAVSVTASFGLCAAGWVINTVAENARGKVQRLSESNEMTL
jgi:tRNA threonylcarbamoyladenosine dehydratase